MVDSALDYCYIMAKYAFFILVVIFSYTFSQPSCLHVLGAILVLPSHGFSVARLFLSLLVSFSSFVSEGKESYLVVGGDESDSK